MDSCCLTALGWSMEPRTIIQLRTALVAFTLVELMVVVAIIGVLVALLLPAVQSAREAARRSQCINNLRQIGVATMHFESVNRRLPKGDWRQRTSSTGVDSLGTWISLTLPYLEEADLYGNIDFSRPFLSRQTPAILSGRIKCFLTLISARRSEK